jgi:REP element-mobilizing transposase RayT
MRLYGHFITDVIQNLTATHKFAVDNMKHDNDHLHMLISARPDISASYIVKTIKQHTSYELWKALTMN